MALVPYAGGSGGSLLMQCPVLTVDTCTVWAIKVEANLDASGLWEAVALTEDAAATVIMKKDKPARAYLLEALSEDILLQVSSRKMAAGLWASLKTRFFGADWVRAARLATIRGEFERLRMTEAETLDAFPGKIDGMATRYAGLGSTLDDAAIVKKLLDSMLDWLYMAVAGIEKFCNVESMPLEEALGQLKTFDERSRRRMQAVG